MDEAAADRIFGDQDLLAEILARLPSARQVVRTKAVGKKFKSATEEGRFVDQYVEHHQPSIISFLVKFEGVFGSSFQLYDAQAAPADDTVVALRARINKEALQADRVVAARGGFVLRANWIHPGNYTVSCPPTSPGCTPSSQRRCRRYRASPISTPTTPMASSALCWRQDLLEVWLSSN
jgi:hypothetical protein